MTNTVHLDDRTRTAEEFLRIDRRTSDGEWRHEIVDDRIGSSTCGPSAWAHGCPGVSESLSLT